MANEMQGISALDPRVAATDQFISEKQIPPDQVPAFLMQMGADPRMVGLVFKYQRLKDAAAKQQGPAPTSTVAQDVDQQYAQLQSGLGSLPAPVMENAQFQGGIAPDQEAPPQMMAGGGIVAFSNGGSPQLNQEQLKVLAESILKTHPALRTREQNDILRLAGYELIQEAPVEVPTIFETGRAARPRGGRADIQTIAPAAPATTPATPTNVPPQGTIMPDSQGPSFDAAIAAARGNIKQDVSEAPAAPSSLGVAPPEFIRTDISPLRERMESTRAAVPKSIEEAEAEALKREEGFGETEAIKARRAKLDELEKKVTTSPEKKLWLAFAQAGFAASAKGARDLWETLSIGGVEGIKAYQSMKDKEQEALEKLEDKRLQLDSMSANIKRMASKTGREEFRALEKAALDAENNYINILTALNNADSTNAAQNWRTQVEAQTAREGRELKDPVDRLTQRVIDALETGNQEEADKLIGQLSKITAMQPSVIVAEINRKIAEQRDRSRYPYGVGGFNLSAIDEELAKRSQ